MSKHYEQLPQEEKQKNSKDELILKYIQLVNIIKTSKDQEQVNASFNHLVSLLDHKLKQFSYNFTIPGHDNNDIYQQILFALRYKAIKDYKYDKSNIKQVSPFDKFAFMCIRRYLSTRLKASYNLNAKALNTYVSMHQERKTGNHNDQDTCLADILPGETQDIMTKFSKKQYRNNLFNQLFDNLSVLQKKIFALYARDMSYIQISQLIIKDFTKQQCQLIINSQLQKDLNKILKSNNQKWSSKKILFQQLKNKSKNKQQLLLSLNNLISKQQKQQILMAKIMKAIDNGLSRIKQKAAQIKQINQWQEDIEQNN